MCNGEGTETVLMATAGPGLPSPLPARRRTPGWSSAAIGVGGLGPNWAAGAVGSSHRSALLGAGPLCREAEQVRAALDLAKVHVLGKKGAEQLGHLAIHRILPDLSANVKSCVLADGACDIPQSGSASWARLRGAWGRETVSMMVFHEAPGTLGHPEYQGGGDPA